MKTLLVLFAALLAAPAFAQTSRLQNVENPTPAGATQANLTNGAAGDLLLSWLEADKAGDYSLRYSVRHAGAWSPARTIAARRPFFHHPAELPEVMALSDGSLVAHWIETAANSDADDAEFVNVSASRDGIKWTAPIVAHRDRHPVEHGLASMTASGDHEVSIVWLEALKGPDAPTAMKRSVLTFDGTAVKLIKEESLVPDVCECCPTSVIRTAKGLLVAYRAHSKADIRDIAVTRLEAGKWTPGKIVAADNWEIDACPTNAASAAIAGNNVTVSWYTAAGNKARVEAAVSADGGATFGKAITVSTGQAYGYASSAADTSGAFVSWLERNASGGASVLARYVKTSGELGPVIEVAQGTRQALGYPRLLHAGNETWITWNTKEKAQTARLLQ